MTLSQKAPKKSNKRNLRTALRDAPSESFRRRLAPNVPPASEPTADDDDNGGGSVKLDDCDIVLPAARPGNVVDCRFDTLFAPICADAASGAGNDAIDPESAGVAAVDVDRDGVVIVVGERGRSVAEDADSDDDAPSSNNDLTKSTLEQRMTASMSG